MAASYDQVLEALFRAPHASFVAERQRLAAELKAAGDADGAARLAKLGRPPISAWAVNQLWWNERAAFAELFESAARLRAGALDESSAFRRAIAELAQRARKLLAAGGHSANEATLRKVEATLAGLGAAGGFDPDPAGALTKDRDPPGFDAFGGTTFGAKEPRKESRTEAAGADRARAEAAEQRTREAEEIARKQAEKRERQAALSAAEGELLSRRRERERLAKELAAAEQAEEQARAAVEKARARLASSDDER